MVVEHNICQHKTEPCVETLPPLFRETPLGRLVVSDSLGPADAIRYLATHDNSFIRYFDGHDQSVTALAVHPGSDNFLSCSRDGTVRLWDFGSSRWQGLRYLSTPYLAEGDPSGTVFAVASPASGSILLYDLRNYAKAPFSTFDIVEQCGAVNSHNLLEGWTKLEFANDGKSLLLGTRGDGHFLLDSFSGTLKAYLYKPDGHTRRPGVGEGSLSATDVTQMEGSGECCFSPDGRYVLSGAKQNVLVWDTLATVGENKTLKPTYVLEDKREAAVLAFNPRFHFFATADRDLVFWVPELHV